MTTALSWQLFGTSVRGPSHLRDGIPNQDSWVGKSCASATIIVVCDGMGSRPLSQVGSRQACFAVADAIRLWTGGRDAPVEMLLRLIHDLWAIRVHEHGKEACATTCMFAAATRDGRVIVAQLGDGLALLKKPNGEIHALQPNKADGFTNETNALGLANSLRDWRWHMETNVPSGTCCLLATDGIAEDLVAEKVPAFVDFVRQEYGPLDAACRWRKLTKDLRQWPVPSHADDKTLALMWHESSEEQ